ncbi:hypothetical protein Taro_021890, partial [Colocasia esculenta]|nr:hypothetical protein [Colocasia esculenta]
RVRERRFVTSRIFRILVDRVFSTCGGQCEANVSCVSCVCVFLGLTGPTVWAYSTVDCSACHRDRKVCRVLNATEVAVTFMWLPREFGRTRGNAGRSLHNVFFAKVVDAYRGYLSSWVPQCVVSLARLRPVRGRRTQVKHITGLTGLDEAFRHSWYQSKVVVMADRREWGGGGDDPEESTQRMIERIWESLTDIQMRMDHQAPVPLVVGEAVPVALVPPPPGVEVPFVALVPPSPPPTP